MKKISFYTLLGMCVLFISQASQVLAATCTLNGEVIPCEQMPVWPFYMGAVFFILMMVGMIFWIWMVVDVVKHEDEKEKLMWVLIVILLQIIGAIIYYVVRKHPREKNQRKSMSTDHNERQ